MSYIQYGCGHKEEVGDNLTTEQVVDKSREHIKKVHRPNVIEGEIVNKQV